mmetsp:Transcript_20216/g.63330  ORF Transcript_20216/g.63330 Transcript_20216/m.63330 type:complete len:201 (-) Transcript_20216:77-679(-)
MREEAEGLLVYNVEGDVCGIPEEKTGGDGGRGRRDPRLPLLHHDAGGRGHHVHGRLVQRRLLAPGRGGLAAAGPKGCASRGLLPRLHGGQEQQRRGRGQAGPWSVGRRAGRARRRRAEALLLRRPWRQGRRGRREPRPRRGGGEGQVPHQGARGQEEREQQAQGGRARPRPQHGALPGQERQSGRRNRAPGRHRGSATQQ